MSLTSQIVMPTSPFMQFARHAIPDSAAVTAVHDGVHRTALKASSDHSGTRPDWGLIGTAIDFRLRVAFTSDDVVPSSAQLGHAALTKRHPQVALLLGELAAATTRVLDAAPERRGRIELPESSEIELIRLCVVAAQLDQLYRAYSFVIDKTTLLDGSSVVLFDKALAQIPWFVIDQVHDQVRRANSGLGPLHSDFTRAISGMSFAGSALVGGADADLLVDGLLLDFKSTHKATSIGRSDVYQLAGYVLLDFDDVHQMDRVGVYWTRHAVLRTFTLPTFFQLLGATAPIAELRSELRRHLTALEHQRRSLHIASEQRPDEHPATGPQQPAEVGESQQPNSKAGLRRAAHWLRRVRTV